MVLCVCFLSTIVRRSQVWREFGWCGEARLELSEVRWYLGGGPSFDVVNVPKLFKHCGINKKNVDDVKKCKTSMTSTMCLRVWCDGLVVDIYDLMSLAELTT